MPRWTTSDAENKHLSDIHNQIFESLGPSPATTILKDGRHIIGKILPSSAGNNKGQGVPERGYAMAIIQTDDGEIEVDLLDIERVFAGRPN